MLLFVDKLTNVDFSFLDDERGLLGETWLANIRLQGDLDQQGMVCDFGTVKKVVRRWLDEELDHRLAIPLRSPRLTLTEDGDQLDIQWRYANSSEILHTRCPRSSVALIDSELLTPDTIACWCIDQLRALFPDSIEQLGLTFSAEVIEGAFYHYSHGLKKHDGNCQRIAHGHRSRIDIYLDGVKSPQQETLWAERWKDIYVGTREDIVAEPTVAGHSCYRFAYTSAQGYFEITLPRSRCYLLDSDSTVELIARHIAEKTAADNPGRQVMVRAFEGINKGAEVTAAPC